MRPIPPKLKKEMGADPYYKVCAHKDENCDGRVTWEHTIIYASKQLNEKWAIIPICAYHHAVDRHQDGPGLDKQRNVWVALNRATDDELIAVSKVVNYMRERDRLNTIYN